MKSKINRIKIKYKQKIKIPEEFKKYFWDEPDGFTFLEKFILRVFKYGSFEEIRRVYDKYSSEAYDIGFRYPDIKRGIKFWLKRWKGEI